MGHMFTLGWLFPAEESNGLGVLPWMSRHILAVEMAAFPFYRWCVRACTCVFVCVPCVRGCTCTTTCMGGFHTGALALLLLTAGSLAWELLGIPISCPANCSNAVSPYSGYCSLTRGVLGLFTFTWQAPFVTKPSL